jgi:hypothetical protein|tara:strand:- start:500 stop:1120 length:621 start_codon:yes stop_codon:yes gene_type:complete
MSISARLTESVAQIEKKIMRAIVDEANATFLKSVSRSLEPIRVIVRAAIQSCPEIASLNAGTLRADFGIPAGKDATTEIVNSIANSVTFMTQKFSLKGKNITGGLTVGIQPTSFVNLLGIGNTELESGGSIPWLQWLLTSGDSIIIADFGVKYGPYGRSGMGAMTMKQRPFKVDSSFSGTSTDNFITRALAPKAGQIEKAIIRSLS